jgi:thioredoxin 1
LKKNFKQEIMKTKILISSVVLAVALISCGSKADKANTGDKVADNSTEVLNNDGKAIKLTKEMFLEKVMNYEENETWKYEGELPAIIDFYADWCAPCRTTSPILDELAKEYEGKVIIYKIDTEVERELASVFGIRSLPSFLYIPVNGDPFMSAGIARTPEDTKKMFIDQINQYLLTTEEKSL